MKNILQVAAALVAVLVFLSGCAITAGGRPILGIETERDRDGKSVPMFGTVITVHQYGVATQPQPAPPGTPPLPPRPMKPSVQDEGAQLDELILGSSPPRPAQRAATTDTSNAPVSSPAPPAAYRGIYNDPTVRTFINQGPYPVRVKVGVAEAEFRLLPWQSTADIAFPPGEYRVMVTLERPTANFGTLEVVRFVNIFVRPDGAGWEPIYIGF